MPASRSQATWTNREILADGTNKVLVPDGLQEAMAMVSRLAVVRRQPMDIESVPLNVGIFTGPKFDEYRLYIMGLLKNELGEEKANSFADLLCTTGMVPNPTSSPHHLTIDAVEPEIVRHVYACVEALSWKVYGLEPIFSNVHVNSESSTTFPFFLRGADGVAIKRAYHESYMKYADAIYDELSAFDLSKLQSSRIHLPLFGTTYTGGRVQVRGMKEVCWQGDRIVKAIIKPMKCHNYLGVEMAMDMDIPGSKVFHTMRGREISSASMTTNQLAQEILTPIRNAMYEKGVWHASDWGVELKARRSMALAHGWPQFRLQTYDFSRMDAHMTRPMFESYLRGARRAGWSQAYLNLARWIHFSPVMCPCDMKNAKYEERFTKIYGSEKEQLAEFDAGQRSGQWDTDVSNKIYGTSAYMVAAVWSGQFNSISAPAIKGDKLVQFYRTLIDKKWSSFFDGKPDYGDHCFIVGNCGDDNEIAFDSDDAMKAYNAICRKFAPIFDITEEPFCNFLGNRHSEDGTSMAFEGKCLTNNLSPEQPINSPRRRDFWPLGMRARDEHYQSNPLYTDVLKPVLDKATSRFYGETWFGLVNKAPVLTALPMPSNAAEANFLWDPSVITYKYTSRDISDDILLASGAYFSIPAEEAAQLYTLFRR